MQGASDLTEGERGEIGAMWAFRAAGEHETAALYADLARRLQAHGVGQETVERVSAAARDEERHHRVCAEMAARAGHPARPARPIVLRRVAPHDLGGGARLCYEMVALYCVTESINATLLLRSWERAADEAARAALHALLADEVRHSRIGWSYLSSDDAFHDELGARLPVMLAAATHGEDFLADPAQVESPALVAHGLLPQADRRRVFLEAMHDVVLPGLELCSVQTADARRWLADCTGRWA